MQPALSMSKMAFLVGLSPGGQRQKMLLLYAPMFALLATTPRAWETATRCQNAHGAQGTWAKSKKERRKASVHVVCIHVMSTLSWFGTHLPLVGDHDTAERLAPTEPVIPKLCIVTLANELLS